jgi:hypothetical protein
MGIANPGEAVQAGSRQSGTSGRTSGTGTSDDTSGTGTSGRSTPERSPSSGGASTPGGASTSGGTNR